MRTEKCRQPLRVHIYRYSCACIAMHKHGRQTNNCEKTLRKIVQTATRTPLLLTTDITKSSCFLVGMFCCFFFQNEISFFQQKTKLFPYPLLLICSTVSHFELHLPISQTISDLFSSGKLGNSCVQKISSCDLIQ